MSNQTARVRFNSLTISTGESRDIEISGEMDVDVRFCDDVDGLEFDLVESVSDIQITSARVPVTDKKVKLSPKFAAKILGVTAVRDRLLDEAQQLGWEWSEKLASDIQNGEVK